MHFCMVLKTWLICVCANELSFTTLSVLITCLYDSLTTLLTKNKMKPINTSGDILAATITF